MSLRRVFSTAIVALGALGCASLRAPLTSPEHGGPPWTEATSAHFILRTDTAPGEVQDLLTQIETLHDALAFALERPASAEVARFIRAERRRAGLLDHASLAGELVP